LKRVRIESVATEATLNSYVCVERRSIVSHPSGSHSRRARREHPGIVGTLRERYVETVKTFGGEAVGEMRPAFHHDVG
jgi:hypothetical protein